MCVGYAPVSSRKRASEKSTFWYESNARGREEAGGAREVQVGLAFGCCGVGGGVVTGRLGGKQKEKARQWAGDAEKERVPVPVRV